MTKPVLIVEDDPMIAIDLETLALEAGATPVCCGTLREAMHAAGRADYVMALLDVDLPDGMTFALARHLRDHGVPVVFVSAVRRADIPAEFSAAPFVPKPYRPAELKAAISAAT